MRILFFLFILTNISFYSCDYVASPKPTTTVSTTGDRKVLIEDMTGHKCPNCPEATRQIIKLQTQPPTNYGDKLIAVAIHGATKFSDADATGDYTYNFKTTSGDELNSFFKFSVYPSGMVNRTAYNATTKTHLTQYTKWGGLTAPFLNMQADVNINIINSYDTISRSLNTTVINTFKNDKKGTFKLTLYLTEDSIIQPQVDLKANPNDVLDYVHRHVLRDVINKNNGPQPSGDLLKTGSVTTGETITKIFNYTIPLNDPKNTGFTYNDKHMYVIAFVYDDDPASSTYKEILQVEEAKVR